MSPIATGTRERRGDEDAIVLVRHLNSPVAEVWASITESARLAAWIGTWKGDPDTGSIEFTMGFEGEGVEPETYTINACREPRHLAVTSAMAYDENNPAEWHLELDLEEVAAGTRLTFSQTIPDPSWAENIGPGWEYYMDRLVAAVHGSDPGVLDFDDYYPSLSSHYQELFPTRS